MTLYAILYHLLRMAGQELELPKVSLDLDTDEHNSDAK